MQTHIASARAFTGQSAIALILGAPCRPARRYAPQHPADPEHRNVGHGGTNHRDDSSPARMTMTRMPGQLAEQLPQPGLGVRQRCVIQPIALRRRTDRV
ncbi:hypothetical protein [Micromonospora tulbaghiae]|uniref:hypothetical protein n=1 Tax=Micromonospora tulbaghiae TaxID=479978 RepID=UPI0013C43842|nr:hypothetical protein [Micromonospora tulbaghiae]